jgi:tRNA(Ile)-lysidine synthase TilS/MesJ
MKQANRKKVAAAIQAGIPHLWNGRGKYCYTHGKSDFVCYAIEHGLGRWNSDVEAAKKMIHARIYPYCRVEDWLVSKGVKHIPTRKLQAYRKAWMKQMIEEFSK